MMHSIILIMLTVLEPFVFGEECQSFYTTQSLCDTIYGSTLSTYSQIRSLTECVVQCSIDELCLSVIYVNGSGDCHTNTGILVTPDTGCLENVWHASLLQNSCNQVETTTVPVTTTTTTTATTTTAAAPGTIFGHCVINADCAATSDAECRDNTCLCVAGLSFNYQTACVPDCGTYGTSFQPDMGHLIVGYNDRSFTVTSYIDCQNACINELTFTCRTAELYRTTMTCYLSTETVATQPGAHTADAYYDLYQRDCADIAR